MSIPDIQGSVLILGLRPYLSVRYPYFFHSGNRDIYLFSCDHSLNRFRLAQVS
jgi:hypothetical protein